MVFSLILLGIDGVLRVLVGLPLLIFIPGYLLISALFPYKNMDSFERFVLSIGFSVAVVSLLGLFLNYTPWGIRLIPVLISLGVFIFFLGLIAILRWRRSSPEERYTLSLNLSLFKNEDKFSNTLTIILVICLLTLLCLVTYAIITPKIGERFTEFYVSGSNSLAEQYPKNLTIGEHASVLIGIKNHEYRTMNYTVEIWLVNQTTDYNFTSQKNETIYYNFWFLDKVAVTLNHQPLTLDEPWVPQWEYNYTFQINHTGRFKLIFLLYNSSTPDYIQHQDYQLIANQKLNIEFSVPYQTIHLWITVHA